MHTEATALEEWKRQELIVCGVWDPSTIFYIARELRIREDNFFKTFDIVFLEEYERLIVIAEEYFRAGNSSHLKIERLKWRLDKMIHAFIEIYEEDMECEKKGIIPIRLTEEMYYIMARCIEKMREISKYYPVLP
ncbi:MAG: hypothetical protein HY445_00175 [Candidatus Niyogibacteria bacterium]|nr:hypothetical protein [Candidatus Niyogibacteria bacterium]